MKPLTGEVVKVQLEALEGLFGPLGPAAVLNIPKMIDYTPRPLTNFERQTARAERAGSQLKLKGRCFSINSFYAKIEIRHLAKTKTFGRS